MNPNAKAEALNGLAQILNAALEHVPPMTRGLLGQAAQVHLNTLAGPDAAPAVGAQAPAKDTNPEKPPAAKKGSGHAR